MGGKGRGRAVTLTVLLAQKGSISTLTLRGREGGGGEKRYRKCSCLGRGSYRRISEELLDRGKFVGEK